VQCIERVYSWSSKYDTHTLYTIIKLEEGYKTGKIRCAMHRKSEFMEHTLHTIISAKVNPHREVRGGPINNNGAQTTGAVFDLTLCIRDVEPLALLNAQMSFNRSNSSITRTFLIFLSPCTILTIALYDTR